MSDKKTILYDSNEAAWKETREVWVSRAGFVTEDERNARYSGCTHNKCACGEVVEKMYLACESCRENAAWYSYNQYPIVQADKNSVLYDEISGKYFFSVEDFLDHCACEEIDPSETRLVLCEPNHLSEVNVSESNSDIVPEDFDEFDLPEEVLKAEEALNKAIREAAPISWSGSKKRIDIEHLKKTFGWKELAT